MAETPTYQARKPQKKISEYGAQLIEKQKTKRAYGVREKQFRRYFGIAAKDRAQTGQTLLQLLESRIDNVIFRAGLTLSRSQARQLVSHRHIMLNGQRLRTPSVLVKPGDLIKPFKAGWLEARQDVTVPNWLKINKKTLEITVLTLPGAEDLPVEFETQKIVEFYSR